MSRKRIYTYCQTLRLDEQLDDLLTVAAFEKRTSKAAIVRAALREALGLLGRGEQPSMKIPNRRHG
jgi:hypothetical protein